MSEKVLARLQEQFGERIVSTTSYRGDDTAVVEAGAWVEVARFLKSDAACAFDHFTDLTAIDYPEREPELPRFEVVLCVRSYEKRQRVILKTHVADGQTLPTLTGVWAGADWAEREVYDMFGIRFEGHPDLRRVLLYEEFVGHPLRKDYPIGRTQPLVPYRELPDALSKLPPFGADEGQPWTRILWGDRLEGGDQQVSPAIGLQQGQRTALSESSAHRDATESEE